MLIIGEDKDKDGRTWRNVATLDGQTGWVAAQFVLPVDPSMLAAITPGLDELLATVSGTPASVPPGLQARVAVGEGTATPAAPASSPAAATPTPTVPRVAFVGQKPPAPAAGAQTVPAAATAPAATSAPAVTPQPTATMPPTATPIKAPSGATSIDVDDATMSLAGVDHGAPAKLGNRPRQGMELLSIRVKIANDGDKPFALYRGAFRLALSDRSRLEPLAGGADPLPYSAEIAPGDTLEGALVFEVPTGTRIDALVWAPDRDVSYSLAVPS
jgi:hypothetical protein